MICVVRALVQTKSQACYEVTLRALKRAAPGFNPEKAMVDFEMGQANAWEVVFPNIELSGCLFHSSNKGLGGPF